jgi:hypothetical protein
MSYAAFLWWQESEQTTAYAELQKVQRLAYLLTTGAMKSAPTIALEAMFDLPPLPAMVKKEAAQSINLECWIHSNPILETCKDI